MRKRKRIIHAAAVILPLLLCAGVLYGCSKSGGGPEKEKVSPEDDTEAWENAEHTPLGKYPETVEYTLGKISGANNSNLPAGETYEEGNL